MSAALPWAMPPLLQPLVVAGPFGSGKRAVLQRLVAVLPDVLAVPNVVTSKPHSPGKVEGESAACAAIHGATVCDEDQSTALGIPSRIFSMYKVLGVHSIVFAAHSMPHHVVCRYGDGVTGGSTADAGCRPVSGAPGGPGAHLRDHQFCCAQAAGHGQAASA